MRKKYLLKEDRLGYKAGIIVYEFTGHTYGLDRDEYLATGKYHFAVTEKDDGAYPFFTVTQDMVEEIESVS